jgi:cellobiose phosphorylase
MKEFDRNNPEAYYAFEDEKREVLIKRYDTPGPWMNYLSNGTFHTMISQAGGGVAFYKSPQIWRINRYRFFHLPTDRSGFYCYLRDKKNGKYWCPTAEPALEKPNTWQAWHGTGYTRFLAGKDNLKADLTYFVGKEPNALVWKLRLTNTSHQEKELDLFSYVEFGMMEYLREVSWACYMKHQMTVYFLEKEDALVFKYGVENQPRPKETPLVYFAGNISLKGYDGDRDEFIGTYRSESNPYVLDKGDCTGSTLFGGDPCGALQFDVKLAPGEEKEIHVFLGTAADETEIVEDVRKLRETGFVEQSLAGLKKDWDKYFSKFTCQLPDKKIERQVNTWNPYQVQRNFLFSRNISFYATGTFRGVGFRDTAQDILAQVPYDLNGSKEKTRLLLGQQYQDGHVNHYFFPTEGYEPINRLHSDNHLWPVLAVWNIVMEEGKLDFLSEQISFYDGENASVYEHLRRSVNFSMKNLGKNGLPLMLHSDWNDQMFRVCREGKGESFWVAMQLGLVLPKLAELSRLLGEEQDETRFMEIWKKQKDLVNTIGWDGKWFRRAIMDNGLFLGSNNNPEAKVWLNAQSWAVLSGFITRERGIQVMDIVKDKLDTELGIKIIHPSITTFPDPEEPLTNYNKGTGENGAVFCHANTWAIIAECMLGRGNQAYKYFKQLVPSQAMQKAGAWRYKAEPYVYVSNIFGPESDKFGLANVSWLTGTAAWMHVAFSQHILGMRPAWDGLVIDPVLPDEWDSIEVERAFRGNRYRIQISNTKGEKRKPRLYVNGEELEGNIVPFSPGQKEVNIKVII